MTEKENKRLAELLAKKAQEEKEDAAFFKQVRKRKWEVLKELKVDRDVYDKIVGKSLKQFELSYRQRQPYEKIDTK